MYHPIKNNLAKGPSPLQFPTGFAWFFVKKKIEDNPRLKTQLKTKIEICLHFLFLFNDSGFDKL